MMFNLIALICLILTFLLGRILIKFKYGEIVLRGLSILIFAYKVVWYVINNVRGHFSIPVEISSISYFMVSAILTFKISKLFNIAAFFGTSAGMGFFLFYLIAGFIVSGNFTVGEFLISNFSHGYLLLAGIYLTAKNNFIKSNKMSIWVTILGMLFWALLFFDVQQRGITFVYYLIKPTYLFIFNSLYLNIMIMVLFYCFIILLFYLWIKLYFKINNKVFRV